MINKRYIFNRLFLSLLAELFVQECLAQTSDIVNSPHKSVSTQKFVQQQDAAVPGWASGKWSASDKVFLPIISDTDQSAAKGMLNSESVSDAIETAKNNPDAINVATAAYREYRLLRITFPQNYQDLNTVVDLVKKVPDPHTYLFSKVAFLVSAYDPPTDNPWLTSLGDRLLMHEPNDPDLVYARVRAGFPYILSSTEKKKLLKYANYLVVVHPRNLTSYMALEMVYGASFLSSGNHADGIMTLGLLKKEYELDQNLARRAWYINEIKMNQILLSEDTKRHIK